MAQKILPVLAKVLARRKRRVRSSWRVDETCISLAGQCKCHYRVVDRDGNAADFFLTTKRDLAAARRFPARAIDLHDFPEKITIERSRANSAAIGSIIADTGARLICRQSK